VADDRGDLRGASGLGFGGNSAELGLAAMVAGLRASGACHAIHRRHENRPPLDRGAHVSHRWRFSACYHACKLGALDSWTSLLPPLGLRHTPRMNDKLLALRLFVRVARTGSFSAAARELDLSQPSVSRIIAALEETLARRW
jgi:heme A synthase